MPLYLIISNVIPWRHHRHPFLAFTCLHFDLSFQLFNLMEDGIGLEVSAFYWRRLLPFFVLLHFPP